MTKISKSDMQTGATESALKQSAASAMEKPRILVYLYCFFPFENANTNVMLPLLDALSARYEVDVFTCNMDGSASAQETLRGFRVFRFARHQNVPNRLYMLARVSAQYAKSSLVPVRYAAWRMLQGKTAQRVTARWDSRRRAAWTPVRKALAALVEQNHYAAVLSVSSPIQPQDDVLALTRHGVLQRMGCRWAVYMTDPEATFIWYRQHEAELLERERAFYQTADAVFTTPELCEQTAHNALREYLPRVFPVQLASLQQPENGAPVPFLRKDKINCVYVGSLFNASVRDPSYFFQMAAACPDLEFHIVCNCLSAENLATKERYLKGASQVHWHDRQPLSVCKSLMCQADVMINLGNRCLNQTPSKLFEYISTGKPIVNFCSQEQDTSEHYLERYPFHLKIQNRKNLEPGDVERLTSFAKETGRREISFAQVKLLYPDCDAARVAAEFCDQFQAVLAGKTPLPTEKTI